MDLLGIPEDILADILADILEDMDIQVVVIRESDPFILVRHTEVAV